MNQVLTIGHRGAKAHAPPLLAFALHWRHAQSKARTPTQPPQPPRPPAA